jgi:hypothetical protein
MDSRLFIHRQYFATYQSGDEAGKSLVGHAAHISFDDCAFFHDKFRDWSSLLDICIEVLGALDEAA